MKQLLSHFWKTERRDFTLLSILIFSIPICWIVILGWNSYFSISGNDATKILFPFYPDLVREHGNWQSLLYRSEILGGFIIEGYFGSYPITRTLANLGFSPLVCLNFTFLIIQIIYSFFSTRIALDLSTELTPAGRSKNEKIKGDRTSTFETLLTKISGYLGFGLLNSFLPVLAWRMSFGHPNIISGSFLFLSFFSLILAQQVQRVTLTLITITIIALTNCFQYQSHQMVLYSIVFGAPILLGLAWPQTKQNLRTSLNLFKLPTLIAIGSFAYSWVVFWPFLLHAISSDTARSILGKNITYSYITATLADWLTSIPWSLGFLNAERENHFIHHEVNYPFGPLLLLLALIPWKTSNHNRWKYLGRGLIVSGCMALVFSMKLEPFATLLSTLLPPLKFFRVPERAILPLCFTVPILASAILLAKISTPASMPRSISFLLFGALVLFFPPETRELFLWLICLFAVIQKYSQNIHSNLRFSTLVSTGAILFVLGMGSILEFKERLIPFWSANTLEDIPAQYKNEIYQQAPALQSSLTRTILDIEPEPYSLNKGYVLGVSTLSGYFSPPIRFLNLYFALGEMTPDIMNQVFVFNESTRGYYQLRELYNVDYKAAEMNGHYHVAQIELNRSEAWFSGQIQASSSILQVAMTLKGQEQGLRNYLRNFMTLVTEDSMVKKAELPDTVAESCSEAKVLEVSAPQHSQRVDLKVTSPATCPLTISMNYVEILDAIGQTASGTTEKLKVFPAYGALTGILVPKEITSIRVEPKVTIPWIATVFRILGALLLLGVLGVNLKIRFKQLQ